MYGCVHAPRCLGWVPLRLSRHGCSHVPCVGWRWAWRWRWSWCSSSLLRPPVFPATCLRGRRPQRTECCFTSFRHTRSSAASASPYCQRGTPSSPVPSCVPRARTHHQHTHGEAGGGNTTQCPQPIPGQHVVVARSHFGRQLRSGHGRRLNRTMGGTATPCPRSLALSLSRTFALFLLLALHLRDSALARRARFSTRPTLAASLGRQTAIVSTLSQA